SITMAFEYCRQAGQVYFDGLSLFREEFGQSFVYDDKERVTSSVDAAKQSSTFSYNANSELTGITDPLGNNFTYTYDSKHNVTQGKSAENVKYCMTYDSHGNITRSGAASSGDAANGTWVDRSMCALGHHAASVKDTEGKQTSYVWEEQTDRLAYIGDPNGNIRSFSYDTAGRLVNTSQHADVDGVEQEIQNSYTYGTGSDRLARITHNGFDYVFTYDGFGNLTRVQTAASGTAHDLASYTYGTANSHLNGSLQKITYGDGSEISYVYDDLDRVVETKYKAAGSSSAATLGTFTYNGQGDLYCTSIPNGRSYYMEYDLLGRLMHVRDSDGCTFQYTYDANNRMKRLEHWNGARRGLMSYSYDGDGRETLVSMGGLDRESAYDSCSRLTSRIWNEGGTALADNVSSRYRYTSTESGTRLGTLPTALETGGGEFQYTYDGNGNITQIKRIDVLTTGTVTDKFHYDAANQLVREDSKSQDKTFQYLYDAGGNLKAIRQYDYTTGTLPSTPSVTVTATYSTGVWKDQLTNWNGKVITYDANGCMTQKGTGTTYSWGANRRLASVSNGSTVSYAYDLSGARIRKTVNGTLTEYRWGGSLLLSEKTGSDTICYYYDTAGILTGMALNGTLYLYIRNLQGDVIGIANRLGMVVVQYAYDSWGNIIGITGSMATTVGAKNPFRYRGYYYDAETGMYYLGSRYYDPEIRRFISADSYAATGFVNVAKNTYLYCYSNPITFCDAKGHFPIPALVGIGLLYVGQAIIKISPQITNCIREGTEDITQKLDQQMQIATETIDCFRRNGDFLGAVFFFAYSFNNFKQWDLKRLRPGDAKNRLNWDLQKNKTYIWHGKYLRYDDPGNILYGYVGARLFSEKTLLKAGDAIQFITDLKHLKLTFHDDPHDQEMIQLGYALWERTR
ncbi:MAG: hypothetical protein IJX90_01040, partial [Blautia sp.]|nr:hypothetical protein [Blautia sp.]